MANYAFIDGQNLHLGVSNDVVNKRGKTVYTGQRLDYKKFRSYLRDKYGVEQAYLFIGFVQSNNKLYSYLQKAGYVLVFKTISTYTDESGEVQTKGNVDTDIVLYSAAVLIDEYDKGIFVSGDGDFLSLYAYLNDKGKLGSILVPNRHRYSRLLNEFRSRLRFVSDLRPVFNASKKTRSGGRRETLGLPSRGDATNVAQNEPKSNAGRSERRAK